MSYPPGTTAAHKKGTVVKIEREAPSMGSWEKYNGRIGVIVNVNLETFDNSKRVYIEYGVNFTVNHNSSRITKTEADAWFLPTEITPLYKEDFIKGPDQGVILPLDDSKTLVDYPRSGTPSRAV